MSDSNSSSKSGKTTVTSSSTMDDAKAQMDVEIGADGLCYDQPRSIRRGLTEVSQMFDRNGKGYLDDTERALRRMDTQNKGHLGIDKVCVIFESLQSEQERSSKLLEALQVESRKTLNLKKGVIALSVFALLLAVANIGTSFAVAQLVKETSVGANGNLVAAGTDQRVGTTAKVVSFQMEPLDERRRLQHSRFLVEACQKQVQIYQGVATEATCKVAGTIRKSVAEAMYNELKTDKNVLLECGPQNNVYRTTFLGLDAVPPVPPGMVPDLGMFAYPSKNTTMKYEAEQWVTDPRTAFAPPRRCKAEINPSFYCMEGVSDECYVMYFMDPYKIQSDGNTYQCRTAPEICPPMRLDVQ